MSQFSNTYTSSNYEGASLDALQYLLPNDTLFTTPYALRSQQTLISTYDSYQFAPLRSATYIGILSINKYRKGVNYTKFALRRPNIKNLLKIAIYYIPLYYLRY